MARDLLLDARKVHCMGVGGIGVSGVAALLRARGCEVDGCDGAISPGMRRWLEARGIRVSDGHSPAHVDEGRPDLVVRTPAVGDSCPEIARAEELGVPVMSRGAALAEIVNVSDGIAVCGTHGKTTTSCMVVALLRALGVSGAGWCIGGFTPSMGGVAQPPAAGSPLVVEADESDGTLALYRPSVCVVTSVDRDHLEHFRSFDDLASCFKAVCAATTGAVVFWQDDPRVSAVAARPGAIGYGFSPESRLRATDVACASGGSSFDLHFNGEFLGRFAISVPGRHNVLNALGALGACVARGFAPQVAAKALSALAELPMRRYETHATDAGFEIVSDYSHHPAEIKALVETARLRPHRRIVAVFQPHRYTRTKALLDDFPGAFEGVDEFLLLPVYAASEQPLLGGKSTDLYRAFRKRNADNPAIPVPRLALSIEAAAGYLASGSGPQSGDVLLVVGAGSVVRIVEMVAEGVAAGCRAPLAPCGKVSYGIAATADAFEEIRDEAALAQALSTSATRVMGRATNLVVSDIGARGKVVRLRIDGFEILDDGQTVRVGCGLDGPRLLALLRDAGLSGLEFMAGIPGTVGGWLAMNAGTRFGAAGDRVVEVVAYGPGGARHVATREACGFAYRSCAFLEGKVALWATFRLDVDSADAIARRMEEFRSKRFDFGGMRTAGSVFKNPEGTSAGKVLDEAGCKGMRVGGTYVCDRHANIVAAEPGATASDVIALVELMHDSALEKTGIDLHRELKVWQ